MIFGIHYFFINNTLNILYNTLNMLNNSYIKF